MSPRVAIVHEALRAAEGPKRFGDLVNGFETVGAQAVLVAWDDDEEAAFHQALDRFDAALVWVNPLQGGGTRTRLDNALREEAHRLFVSAHPDVVARLGTKEVLVSTASLSWSDGDTYLHRDPGEAASELARRLPEGPRVLKRLRGNGGQGVWRVRLANPGHAAHDPLVPVEVLEAGRGSGVEVMGLREFVAQLAPHLANGGVIDQAFHSPTPDGMTRCYLVGDAVAGFGHQAVTALVPAPDGGPPRPAPPRLYYGSDEPRFQALRRRMETEWVPDLLACLDLTAQDLPVLWDVDFLIDGQTPEGDPRYVLCEINASAVHPFPASCLKPMVRATLAQVRA